MELFKNHKKLGLWLFSKGVDVSKWGTGGAKSVKNLWSELMAGETVLTARPLHRRVSAVELFVKRDKKYLIERKQRLKDGRFRPINRRPREKLHANENLFKAVLRCAEEELGAAPERVRVLSKSSRPKNIYRNSSSYPGLPTHYRVYAVRIKIDGLPGRSFITREKGRSGPVSEHFWAWGSI